MFRKSIHVIPAIIVLSVILLIPIPLYASGSSPSEFSGPAISTEALSSVSFEDSAIPAFSDEPFISLNNNVPEFFIDEITTEPYVIFSPLDDLGRTGAAMACLSTQTMPSEPRGEIGDIKPSGWQTVRYDDLIEDGFLFNRCHVIGYQLCGDNATPENLFTGTRFLNADSMLFFEDKVSDYLSKNNESHVIYRVTPIYNGNNLVATGVQMEAFSVEDYGKSVCFNVFVYNIQPGIEITYATGDSKESSAVANSVPGAAAAFGTLEEPELLQLEAVSSAQDSSSAKSLSPETEADITETEPAAVETEAEIAETPETTAETEASQEVTYILNTNTKKFHYPACSSVSDMKEKNKQEFYGSREEAIGMGYDPCGRCHP